MATRAASICRAVSRPHSVACRPKSPNETSSPPLARPAIRPFIDLRNFVLLGDSIVLALASRLRRLLERPAHALRGEHFALEDPTLDADDPVGGAGLGEAVLDVG